MIEQFYDLNVAPFRLVPDPRFFFASGTHARALAFLEYGLQQGEGFVVLTGDVGIGKSTVLAYLLERIDVRSIEVVHLANTNLGPVDALRRIFALFGRTDDLRDKAALLGAIEMHLGELVRSGRRALLVVDEAQNLPADTLEELRMLTNLQTEATFPLQCFLVGQPQLRSMVARPENEQLRQRVIASYHLESLNEAELEQYVEHRLCVAGWQGRPELAAELYPRLQRASGGLPRKVNALLARLLLLGALEQRDRLDVQMLETVLEDLGGEGLAVIRTGGYGGPTEVAGDDLGSARLTALEARLAEVEAAVFEVIDIVRGLIDQRADDRVTPLPRREAR
jgi:type II secretory pathway predicted ATPase ExeA